MKPLEKMIVTEAASLLRRVALEGSESSEYFWLITLATEAVAQGDEQKAEQFYKMARRSC
jgi:hypothetical protein